MLMGFAIAEPFLLFGGVEGGFVEEADGEDIDGDGF